MLVDRQKDLMRLCKDKGVYKNTAETGWHYLLASGHHTKKFFDFAPGAADADFREIIGREIMQELSRLQLDHEVDVILTPALGGMLICSTLQHLFYGKKPLLFYAEKQANGTLSLKRNFDLTEHHRVLAFDDVYTTGRSLELLRKICDERGALVVTQGAVVNRNPRLDQMKPQALAIPNIFLIHYPIEDEFLPEVCWACLAGIPLEKDGVIVDNEGKPLESG